MIDRESLSRTFYGDAPVPPPWATDCPIRFEVWLAFGERVRTAATHDAAVPAGTTTPALAQGIPNLEVHPPVDVIIAVNEDRAPFWLLSQLNGQGGLGLASLSPNANPVAAGSFVVALVTFAELIRTLIPLTNLATMIRSANALGPSVLRDALRGKAFELTTQTDPQDLASASPEQQEWQAQQLELRRAERAANLAWFLNMLAEVVGHDSGLIESVAKLIETTPTSVSTELPGPFPGRTIDRRRRYPIQSVNLNRKSGPAVSRSRTTIKADAAEQLFAVDTSTLTWAIVDSGIDARHPAFCLLDGDKEVLTPQGLARTRVFRTFDLTYARKDLAGDVAQNGLVDWAEAIRYIEMQPPVAVPEYVLDTINQPWRSPINPHGTHVAGILAANWLKNGLRGICPSLRLYDIRVLNDQGEGDEFSIVAALQLIRHLNEEAGRLLIAGVNLSLSVPHEVANHSCGWTPVCIECDRLTRSGVVVVAAAGNAGFRGPSATIGFGYNTVSISDPGNTDSIITVGSTHRSDPHRHGVSYFSSRGPTADGRLKPDLLAPGEDIDGPVPGGGVQAMHGTSQAAAHVSGAAAMLMARYRELIGRPERIKEILCGTATDLGRERSFQGHGLVDTLRAMQSI